MARRLPFTSGTAHVSLEGALPVETFWKAAPVSVSEVANFAFNREFTNHLDSKLVNYNFKTVYANLWNSSSDYQYSKQQSLDAIKEYAQANEGCDK